MRLAFRAFCAVVTMPFLLGACTDDDPETVVTAKGAGLVRAQGCDDLLLQIQEDAIAKLNQQAERYKNWGGDDYYGTPDRGEAVPGADGDSVSSPEAPTNGGEAPPVGGDDSDEQADDPQGHSETNTQVEDVDEADIVKMSEDGKRMFVLHGSKLKLIDAWPAAELHETGSSDVPGRAFEMFVSKSKLTVFSHVNPTGIADKGEAELKCADCCASQEFTQMSTFDVSGEAPVLEREMIFEGNYVSSRMYGDTVRAVVRGGFSGNDLYYPYIDVYDSFGRQKSQERIEAEIETWRAGVESDIRSAQLHDWIPRAFEKRNGEWGALSEACDGYFIPAPGYVTTGVTRVVTFDMTSESAPSLTSVLGGSDVIYSNTSSIVITQHNWMWDEFGDDDGSKTSVHAFSLDGGETTYQGSGFAPGYLENQFSIHETDGTIFVSTTEQGESTDWEPRNTIVSMTKGTAGALEVLDRSADLGEVGETIFATRFLGERAYVVTFLQTDPLYAVDISDPEDIRVLGELHIPGFSEYIHPLGEGHLLTIGMQNDVRGGVTDGPVEVDPPQDEGGEGETEEPGTGGTGNDIAPDELPPEVEPAEEGVALQIFDVTDPTNPRLVHKKIFDSSYHSEALYDHKAFTFVSDHFGEDSSLLMFPLNTSSPSYHVGLQVMKVSVEDGLDELGNIDHSALIEQNCEANYCYYSEQMRRGVQVDEYVYALSEGGLSAHALDDLSGEGVAALDFEPLVYGYDVCDYYGGERPTPNDGGAIETPSMGGASGTDETDARTEPDSGDMGAGPEEG